MFVFFLSRNVDESIFFCIWMCCMDCEWLRGKIYRFHILFDYTSQCFVCITFNHLRNSDWWRRTRKWYWEWFKRKKFIQIIHPKSPIFFISLHANVGRIGFSIEKEEWLNVVFKNFDLNKIIYFFYKRRINKKKKIAKKIILFLKKMEEEKCPHIYKVTDGESSKI